MIIGTKKSKLTPEGILEKITEYDIFRYYISDRSWKVNVPMLSPLRKENNPSFMIGNRSGKLQFIDFSDTSLKGDCFTFVKIMFNLENLDETLKVIDRDFGLGISASPVNDYKKIISEYKQPEDLGKRYSLVQVITRPFNKEELSYWNDYHQSLDDLRAENVYAIKKVFLNKQLFSHKETELRFGYFYNGFWKIYKPFADKKSKWVPNNTPITTMDGLHNIKDCDLALVNKSKKDYMVTKKIFEHSCAVQNEGLGCFSDHNVEYLKTNSKKQVLSFDSDVTGVKNSQQITRMFDFGYLNVPKIYLSEGIKDWADLAKEHGMKTIEDYFKQKHLI